MNPTVQPELNMCESDLFVNWRVCISAKDKGCKYNPEKRKCVASEGNEICSERSLN